MAKKVVEKKLRAAPFIERNIGHIVVRFTRIRFQLRHLEQKSRVHISGDAVFLPQYQSALDGIIFLGSTAERLKATKLWLDRECSLGRVEPMLILEILLLVYLFDIVSPVIKNEDASKVIERERKRIVQARERLNAEIRDEGRALGNLTPATDEHRRRGEILETKKRVEAGLAKELDQLGTNEYLHDKAKLMASVLEGIREVPLYDDDEFKEAGQPLEAFLERERYRLIQAHENLRKTQRSGHADEVDELMKEFRRIRARLARVKRLSKVLEQIGDAIKRETEALNDLDAHGDEFWSRQDAIDQTRNSIAEVGKRVLGSRSHVSSLGQDDVLKIETTLKELPLYGGEGLEEAEQQIENSDESLDDGLRRCPSAQAEAWHYIEAQAQHLIQNIDKELEHLCEDLVED